MSSLVKSPIFIEYYSHTQCDCYKVNLPFTSYGQETMVLCPVTDGIENARRLAVKVLVSHVVDAIAAVMQESN